jgi:hypothetical protein
MISRADSLSRLLGKGMKCSDARLSAGRITDGLVLTSEGLISDARFPGEWGSMLQRVRLTAHLAE